MTRPAASRLVGGSVLEILVFLADDDVLWREEIPSHSKCSGPAHTTHVLPSTRELVVV